MRDSWRFESVCACLYVCCSRRCLSILSLLSHLSWLFALVGSGDDVTMSYFSSIHEPEPKGTISLKGEICSVCVCVSLCVCTCPCSRCCLSCRVCACVCAYVSLSDSASLSLSHSGASFSAPANSLEFIIGTPKRQYTLRGAQSLSLSVSLALSLSHAPPSLSCSSLSVSLTQTQSPCSLLTPLSLTHLLSHTPTHSRFGRVPQGVDGFSAR